MSSSVRVIVQLNPFLLIKSTSTLNLKQLKIKFDRNISCSLNNKKAIVIARMHIVDNYVSGHLRAPFAQATILFGHFLNGIGNGIQMHFVSSVELPISHEPE